MNYVVVDVGEIVCGAVQGLEGTLCCLRGFLSGAGSVEERD